jgi:uncharacterized membrane protein YuzA (DUF378 family)
MSHVRTGRWLVLLLLLLSLAASVKAEAPAPPALSIRDYVAWLDRLLSRIGPLADDAEVPPAWRVEASGRSFDVSNAWLLRDVRALRARPDRAARDRVLDRLRTLRSEAVSFQQPFPDASASRALLNDILKRREFRDIHGPTRLDRLRQRLLQLVFNLMERLFGFSAIPTVSSLLVYGLIGLAVIVLAAWTFRFMRRSAAAESVVPDRPLVSQKESSVWLSEAHAAAARGNWREAVRLAYWCAVSFLEDKGAWRPDRARTPREYLRLLPPSSEDRPGLTELTRTFELVWYGAEEADSGRFAEALAHLERMGWPT